MKAKIVPDFLPSVVAVVPGDKGLCGRVPVVSQISISPIGTSVSIIHLGLTMSMMPSEMEVAPPDAISRAGILLLYLRLHLPQEHR